MYRIKKQNLSNIALLLKQDQNLFHTQGLALIWGINNRNTLYTTIKRYVKKGVLVRVKKGFYSTVNPQKIDPVKLGVFYLHDYTYLSTESVLSKNGIINQEPFKITLVSQVSKRFSIFKNQYLSRQMKLSVLYQKLGINKVNGYLQANLSRAVVDMLYFNPRYHFDAKNLINWDQVKKYQAKMGLK